MKKIIIEKIKVNADNDTLAISKLSQKPIEVIKITTKRTGLTEWEKLITYAIYSNISYEDLVVQLIRKKYSLNEELAILRKRDTKPSEFNEYNAYVEDCKVRAKQFIEEREKALAK